MDIVKSLDSRLRFPLNNSMSCLSTKPKKVSSLFLACDVQAESLLSFLHKMFLKRLNAIFFFSLAKSLSREVELSFIDHSFGPNLFRACCADTGEGCLSFGPWTTAYRQCQEGVPSHTMDYIYKLVPFCNCGPKKTYTSTSCDNVVIAPLPKGRTSILIGVKV